MAQVVNTGVLHLIRSNTPERRWRTVQAGPSVANVPTRQQDQDFARRLGPMLVNLRAAAGWTREEAEEALGIPASTLGKWERGQHPPKAYDLSVLYLGYTKAGVPADPKWFLDPPSVVRVDPVRERLDELRAQAAAAAADAAAEPRRPSADGRAARRGTRPA